MTLILTLLLLAAPSQVAFPSSSATSWMHPDAFRISLGMSHEQVMERFRKDGRTTSPGTYAGEYMVEYQAGRNLTLQFRKQRLVSMRFELVDFLPAMSGHWARVQAALQQRFGAPDLTPPGTQIRIWNSGSPQVVAALSTLKDDEFGKQGLGFVVVRYFEPPAAAPAPPTSD